jgi:hypothetical protein
VLAAAVELVAAKVDVVPSSRVKTTGTLIEKLRRNGGHTLGSIHDLGGMRLVVPGGRVEQDRIVDGARELFSEAARMPKVIDRRANPVERYRAVHVIIYPDGYPIEVQVRTQWQHLWAEWFERLADQYGRGIRYGDPPATGGETARDVVAQQREQSPCFFRRCEPRVKGFAVGLKRRLKVAPEVKALVRKVEAVPYTSSSNHGCRGRTAGQRMWSVGEPSPRGSACVPSVAYVTPVGCGGACSGLRT